MKLALVGLGTWAEAGHLPVYAGKKLSGQLDVIALCSRDKDKASQWAKRFHIAHAFDDFDKLLEQSRPDILAVTTPDYAHTEFVVKALNAGCHVVVEKPLATSLEDCQKILEAAGKANRRVITLYHKRSDPLWQEAARRVQEGVYGELQAGFATIQNPVTIPAGGYFASDFANHSDPNWFLGSHFYDLIRYISGLNPVAVNARRYEGTLAGKGLSTVDAYKADFMFRRADGEEASVSFLLSWNLPEQAPSMTKQSMLLHFQYGELDLDGTRRGFTEHGADVYRYVNPYFMRQTPGGWAGYGAEFLEEAIMSIVDENYQCSVLLPSLEDAWWASAMAEAVAKSCETESTEPVRPPPGVAL
ncbi:Gfo/Idh/MocA family protein [Hahella ganghwensis]|uniref:Gfo/Idh/MocA family protein n=1 Tax=Hahella ganghwensis TaxID=286420 RepID=UPI000364E294|nr:Gfo/Idh/MocA family oxidoreductase [Hahella ganghwensis]